MQDKVEKGSSTNVSKKSTFSLKGHVKGMPSALLIEECMQQQSHVKPTSRKFKICTMCVG